MSFDFSPIIAIATPTGRGGVGVIRVSGKDLSPFIPALLGDGVTLSPRYASFRTFRNAEGETIDQGLAIYFQAPNSYTGEDVLELQGHGGTVVLQMLQARCLEVGADIDLRLAEPGEFTRRAFLNGKLDLAQAEAVADLIDASTEMAARSASRSLFGAFSARINELVEHTTQLRTLVEATLDFPEESIDFFQKTDARARLDVIKTSLGSVFAQAAQGVLLREGLNVVLAGSPNVGKSSLLNALAGSDVAIVTPIAGTTRDKVKESIQIEGVPINLVDTAGIRTKEETGDEIERIGIERSWAELEQADVILHILEADRGPTRKDEDIASGFPAGVPVVRVWNKIDLSGHKASVDAIEGLSNVYISTTEMDGVDLLRAELLRVAGWQPAGNSPYLARERHLLALRKGYEHLTLAYEHAEQDDEALDLFAEELRLLQESLGEITGAFTSDDLLGRIFSTFCMGK